MSLGEKIYELRTKKGLSQEDMAYELNVSRQAVSKWETDQSLPDLDKIKALASYFNVTIDDLVNGRESEEKVAIVETRYYDENKLKRRILILLKALFLFICFYLAMGIHQIIYINSQTVFPLAFLKNILIKSLFTGGIIFVLIRRIHKNSSKIVLEIVALLVYYFLIIFVNQIYSSEFEQYMDKIMYLNQNNQLAISEFISIVNNVEKFFGVCSLLFIISLVSTMVVRLLYPNGYLMPKEAKEYKTIDLVCSVLIGFFLGIPGLLFQIVWLLDAYKDNKLRFKKMLIGYASGAGAFIVINIILIIF